MPFWNVPRSRLEIQPSLNGSQCLRWASRAMAVSDLASNSMWPPGLTLTAAARTAASRSSNVGRPSTT
jgi:hypothetical protein